MAMAFSWIVAGFSIHFQKWCVSFIWIVGWLNKYQNKNFITAILSLRVLLSQLQSNEAFLGIYLQANKSIWLLGCNNVLYAYFADAYIWFDFEQQYLPKAFPMRSTDFLFCHKLIKLGECYNFALENTLY